MRNLREDIMGNYASAYEEYYRNLNRKAREKDLGNRDNLSNNHGSNNFMTYSDKNVILEELLDKEDRKGTCRVLIFDIMFYGS